MRHVSVVSFFPPCIFEKKQPLTFFKYSTSTKTGGKRLWGIRQDVQVWDRALMVHSLVKPPHEDIDAWVKMASLCRKKGD